MVDVFAEGKHNDTPFLTGMNSGEVRYSGDRGERFTSLYPADSLPLSEKEAAPE
jgi:hypothetical protein